MDFPAFKSMDTSINNQEIELRLCPGCAPGLVPLTDTQKKMRALLGKLRALEEQGHENKMKYETLGDAVAISFLKGSFTCRFVDF